MQFLRLHINPQMPRIDSHATGTAVITVYVAEIENPYRDALIRILTPIPGIRIVGPALDRTDALQNIRLLRPDVVLLDADTPEMNGVEIVRLMRSEGISSIVMMLSDYASPYHRQAAIAAGADLYLDKFLESQKIGPILETLVHILSNPSELIAN
jgi:DNA-binding NarL/FixJ family response regulator